MTLRRPPTILATLLLLLMFVFLLVLVLLMLVLQRIRTNSSHYTAEHSTQHAAPSLMSDEAAGAAAHQRRAEALLAVWAAWAAGTSEIRTRGALAVIAVLRLFAVLGLLCAAGIRGPLLLLAVGSG